MKYRVAIAAMLVAVGIGAGWCWMRLSDKVSSPESPVSAEVSQQVSQSKNLPVVVASARGLSLPTNQTPTVRGTLPIVVKSTVTIDKPVRLAIEAMGVNTIAPLSDDSILAEADGAAQAKLLADARFTLTQELEPSEKVQPALAELLASGAESVQVSVSALTEADRSRVRSVVEQGGGEILTGCLSDATSFKAKMPAALVAELVGRGDVQWLEYFERPKPSNDLAVEPAAMNVRPIWASDENPGGLSGAGELITTSDTGIDTGNRETLHRDLRNQLIGFDVVPGALSKDENGHGTHTAGSIVGDGTESGGQIRGTAWGAKLWAWFCDLGVDEKGESKGLKFPESCDELFRPHGVTSYVHSASWGTQYWRTSAGHYTSESANYDTWVWNHADFLPVFAAGNDGSSSRTVSTTATAKNILTVGATQNLRTQPPQPPDSEEPFENGDPSKTASYSSRGPCADNRIKPDVTAPGTGVLSTRAYGVDYAYGIYDDYYAYDTGTSMATPLTAGSVALIREWLLRRDDFSEEISKKRPTAALLKAIITGGAKDATKPNNEQGWGRVDLAETLYPSNRAVRLVDRIPFAANTNFIYVVETTNAAPLDVQLVWIDYPGSPVLNQSSAKLVNNLDLTVEASHDGVDEIWYGNGGNSADTVNNVESVRLQSAVPTKYIITVNCTKVLYDHTDGGAAALYIRGAFDPEADPEPPVFVRIPERNLGFRLLKPALDAVQEGETLEICQPVNLYDAVTLKRSCTIVATNVDARASAVNVLPGAGLSVGAGKRVLFENVVFTNDAAVAVNAGGTLALSGLVIPGEVTTADATGLELAGSITEPIAVHAPKMDAWDAFGTVSTTPEIAAASADKFTNSDDDELIGGFKDNLLVWSVKPVPDADALMTLEQDGVKMNFRSFRTMVKCLFGDGTLAVRKTCDMGVKLNVENRLTLVGAEPGVTITNGAFASTEIIVAKTGSLVITNLTFDGCWTEKDDVNKMWGERFLCVEGGALTLERGAVLRNIATQVKNTQGQSWGPVTVESGSLTMRSGALIENCRSPIYGGGIYAWAGNVRLEGGTITGCHTAQKGGGVYANTRLGKARVFLSGDITVTGNTYKGDTLLPSDLEIADMTYPVEVTAPLTGSVGIRPVGTSTLAAVFDSSKLTPEEAAASADVLYSNAAPDADGYVQRATVSGNQFVWKLVPPYVPEGSSEAVVRLVYPDGRRESYRTVGEAFKFMDADCAVELLTNVVYRDNFAINYDITLRSDSQADLVYALSRSNDCQLVVDSGRSVTLANVRLDVAIPPPPEEDEEIGALVIVVPKSSNQSLVKVNRGGSLTLEEGAVVSGMWKDSSFDQNARIAPGLFINGGTLTMKKGSLVEDCRNLWVDNVQFGRDSSRGGGVTLYDGATGYLYGGAITNCQAAIGGGLAVWAGSQAFVSGDFTVRSNKSAMSGYAGDDIAVEAGSSLTLVGPLTEEARLGFRCEYAADTNLAANVENWTASWTAEELAVDAAKCYRSDERKVRGVAATNATDAVIVWKTALGEDGSYRPASGEVYFALPEAPNPDPEPVWAEPKPIAFKSIVCTEDLATLVITDAVQWCNYSVFATNTLENGFILTNTAGAFVVEPVTNFQWKMSKPEIELTFPKTGTHRFWKATATPGLIP